VGIAGYQIGQPTPRSESRSEVQVHPALGPFSRWWLGVPPVCALLGPCWRAGPCWRVDRCSVARPWPKVPRRSAAKPGPARGRLHCCRP
jgi:hypothetical protein